MEDLTGAELHFGSDSDIAPGEHHGDASDEEMISTKEDFIELSNILQVLKTAVEYPDDIAKHNEVRKTIKA